MLDIGLEIGARAGGMEAGCDDVADGLTECTPWVLRVETVCSSHMMREHMNLGYGTRTKGNIGFHMVLHISDVANFN